MFSCCTLQTLPAELVVDVLERLDAQSALLLSHTSRRMRATVRRHAKVFAPDTSATDLVLEHAVARQMARKQWKMRVRKVVDCLVDFSRNVMLKSAFLPDAPLAEWYRRIDGVATLAELAPLAVEWAGFLTEDSFYAGWHSGGRETWLHAWAAPERLSLVTTGRLFSRIESSIRWEAVVDSFHQTRSPWTETCFQPGRLDPEGALGEGAALHSKENRMVAAFCQKLAKARFEIVNKPPADRSRGLLGLPNEILLSIVECLELGDLLRVVGTCRRLREIVLSSIKFPDDQPVSVTIADWTVERRWGGFARDVMQPLVEFSRLAMLPRAMARDAPLDRWYARAGDVRSLAEVRSLALEWVDMLAADAQYSPWASWQSAWSAPLTGVLCVQQILAIESNVPWEAVQQDFAEWRHEWVASASSLLHYERLAHVREDTAVGMIRDEVRVRLRPPAARRRVASTCVLG